MSVTRKNALEAELFELFDKYRLDPGEAARECLFVANDICSALGENSVECLRELQAHIDELDAMVSSSLEISESPDGLRLASLGSMHWRASEGVPRWHRLDELSEGEG